MPKNKGPKILL